MQRKTVFVAHPISGDIQGNIKKILDICERIHSHTIIPVAPYLTSLQYLDDSVVEDREMGVAANLECFHRKYIDELWLFGDKISLGMKQEIELAKELGIPIVAKSPGTANELSNF